MPPHSLNGNSQNKMTGRKIMLGHPKFQRVLELRDWFKSNVNFQGWLNFPSGGVPLVRVYYQRGCHVQFISHSEYFVRNPDWAANQQDLVVQCVKRVLYKACSLYCTSVTSVLYKLCSMYFTRCELCIIQGVKCVLYIKIQR